MKWSLFVAHGGEDHDTVVESAQHATELNPYVVVPLAIALIILIPFVIKRIRPKSSLAILVLLGELFVVGVATYTAVPLLSVICIFAGFILAFMFAFGGLA